MLYLACAVACSLAIGMIFKHTGRRGLDRTALLAVNYAAAVATAGALLMLGEAAGAGVAGGLALSPGLVALGLGTGALFIAGFFLLSLATDVAGMALAIGVMRVSVVLPVVAAWAIWSEAPSAWQGAGLVLGSAAFFLIARPASATEAVPAGTLPDEPTGGASGDASGDAAASSPDASAFGVLALLFVVGGAVDVAMKTFDEAFGAQASRVLFLLLVYGVAFGIGASVVVARGVRAGAWPDARRVVGWGALLGVVNYASTDFFLRAVAALPAPFVFPANNVAIVLGGAVLGAQVWGERLSGVNRLGLACAAVALLLLSV